MTSNTAVFLKGTVQVIITVLILCLVYDQALSDNGSALIHATATVEKPTGMVAYSTYNNNSKQQFASLLNNQDFTVNNNLFFLWEPSDEYIINFHITNNDENIFFKLTQDFKYLKKVQSLNKKSSLSLIDLSSIDEKLPFDYSRGVITLISIDK